MRIRVMPGGRLQGTVHVPGDKSIAHRWLILACTASSRSRLTGLPRGLDVRSTASCLAELTLKARPALDLWARNASYGVEGGGSTWNDTPAGVSNGTLEVEGEGRDGLVEPRAALDCGNSGTSMRLLAGILAAGPFVVEPAATRDHTERALDALGAPVRREGLRVGIARFQHEGFEATVPGDPSSAAFLIAAAALSGSEVTVEGVGLNPTRLHFLRV